jgi:hypothetical protein
LKFGISPPGFGQNRQRINGYQNFISQASMHSLDDGVDGAGPSSGKARNKELEKRARAVERELIRCFCRESTNSCFDQLVITLS